MPTNLLTDKAIRSKTLPGKYADGDNLYLRVRDAGSKTFYVITHRGGKERMIKIGPYGQGHHQVSLAEARQRRDQILASLAAGEPPAINVTSSSSEEVQIPVIIPEFGEFALPFLDEIEVEFRNAKHRAQWRSTLTTYCKPIWTKRIDTVTVNDVLGILRPIWRTKNETASRLRGRIERVLGAAKVKGFRTGENPAAWDENLDHLLPKRQKLTRGHHPALPYEDLPQLWRELSARPSISSKALRFLILTAARSGEVLNATWDEIDFEKEIWIIPAARMKAGREHRVPLTGLALEILQEMKAIQLSDYVFPGARDNRPMSDMTLSKCLRSFRDSVTVHGFRSTFRDWVGEETRHSREEAERCLAHRVGDGTEQAYRRGDAIKKRKVILEDWAQFIDPSADRSAVLVPDVQNSIVVSGAQTQETQQKSFNIRHTKEIA